MPQRIQLRHSATPGDKPASLLVAELCANIPDKMLWLGDEAGAPIDLLDIQHIRHGLIIDGDLSVGGGLAVSGPVVLGSTLSVQGGATVGGNLTVAGGVYANNEPGGDGFGFEFTSPNYVWHWGPAGYLDFLSGITGVHYWRAAGVDVMNLSPAGTLTLTGGLVTGTDVRAGGNLVAAGGVWANNQQGTFGLHADSTNHYLSWGVTNYFDWLNNTTGLRSWRAAGVDVMTLSAAGALTITGALGVGGKLNIGGTGWLEGIIGGTETNSDFVSLSQRGGSAGVFGTRTSNSTTSGGEGAWALGGFAINDNTAQIQTAYGAYFEARHYPNAGVTQGIEIGLINQGGIYQGTPHLWSQPGCTLGLLLGAGRDDVSPNNNPTTALVIKGAGTKWQTGIIIAENSIAANGGYPEAPVAIDLPRAYSLLWRDANDLPAAYIRSDVTTSPNYRGSGGIVFTDDGMQLNTGFGLASMALHSADGLLLNGKLTVAGDVIGNGNISAGLGHNVSAGNAVIADHILGFRAGSYGGTVGSWETGSGRGGGLRLNAVTNSLEFGPLDPASGTLTSSVMTLDGAGALTCAGTFTCAGVTAGPIVAHGNVTADGTVAAGALASSGNLAVGGVADITGKLEVRSGIGLHGIAPYANNAAAVAAGHVTADVYFNTTVNALSLVL